MVQVENNKNMKVAKTKGVILNERPEGMSYEDYRLARKEQTKMIKNRRKGFMVWPSKGVFATDKDGKVIPVQSVGTLVGKAPQLEFV